MSCDRHKCANKKITDCQAEKLHREYKSNCPDHQGLTWDRPHCRGKSFLTVKNKEFLYDQCAKKRANFSEKCFNSPDSGHAGAITKMKKFSKACGKEKIKILQDWAKKWNISLDSVSEAVYKDGVRTEQGLEEWLSSDDVTVTVVPTSPRRTEKEFLDTMWASTVTNNRERTISVEEWLDLDEQGM